MASVGTRKSNHFKQPTISNWQKHGGIQTKKDQTTRLLQGNRRIVGTMLLRRELLKNEIWFGGWSLR